MANSTSIRCLILACGNTLRGDDGVGPWLADWIEQRFRAGSGIRVISRQQWMPELAEDIAQAHSVIFIDSSASAAPGSVSLVPVEAAAPGSAIATHHLSAPELLALALEFYGAAPQNACLLTVGAGSTELGEQFSEAVNDALPAACGVLQSTALCLLCGLNFLEIPQRA
jgi:hydrogenase maturation protease